ncbi:MAG: ABC transporter permease [Bacteroidales bacterium]|nr:ABC transporter permease [Bacteroidales bacterium]
MKHLFINFITVIRRYKTSSLLNILGMTVAFASLYIILVQVNYDLTYNKSVKDSERIYLMSTPSWYDNGQYNTFLSRPLSERIISSSPTVEAGGCVTPARDQYDIFVEEGGDLKEHALAIASISMGGLKVFQFETINGKMEDLDNPSTIAICQSAAKRLGLDIGDCIRWSNDINSEKYSVVAVFKDYPRNSLFGLSEAIIKMSDNNIDNWSEWSYTYFVKLNSASDRQFFEDHAVEIEKQILKEEGDDGDTEKSLNRMKIRLFALGECYFSQEVGSPSGEKGNATTTYTLLGIAILVVMIAMINFINFFFALVPVRIRSVNTYKVFGSSRGSLMLSFVLEAVGLIIISLLIAWYLVYLFGTSSLADLISAPLAFNANISMLLTTIVVALVIAVVSSLYPAYYITSFSPAFALKGSFGASGAGKTLRYTLVGLQFVISIGLIICASFIKLQHSYMMNHDMGFDKEMLLVTNTSMKISSSGRDAFGSKLKENPQIKDVAWAAGKVVSEGRMGWGRDFKEENINFQCYPVSWNFLQFMGIEVIEGRDFTPADEMKDNGTFIFNDNARKKFGFTLEDKLQGHKGKTDIVGFCKDFNFKPLQYGLDPFAFYVFGTDPWWYLTHLYIRTTANADIESVIRYVKDVIVEFDPSLNRSKIDIIFFEEELGAQYKKEKQLTTLVTLFTLISVIISLMGVFGLVMFETQYRRREIGLRRVHGASVGRILAMFNVKFIRIVLICFVIACPVSYFVMDSYLSKFAYRVPLYWWVFALALVVVLLITVTVVTLRSLKAATENPVNSIKTE